ncbi:MAG: hypothetical protein DIU52_006215 [bacterium]|jgi:hypothetical protein|nr:MAG: hypothetical protein DIU52_05705 [bacterium]
MILASVSLGFALLVAAAVVVHYRRRAASSEPEPILTDEMIRQIEREGWLHLDDGEPLDLDEIRQQEEQFWEESWDEPDEW